MSRNACRGGIPATKLHQGEGGERKSTWEDGDERPVYDGRKLRPEVKMGPSALRPEVSSAIQRAGGFHLNCNVLVPIVPIDSSLTSRGLRYY